jgi:uncharacterized iron-regulated protein
MELTGLSSPATSEVNTPDLRQVSFWVLWVTVGCGKALVVAASALIMVCLITPEMFTATAGEPTPPWISQNYRDHPLVGKIWRPRTGRFVDRERVISELAKSKFVLLGEKHDNPDHHRLQVIIARELFVSGQRRAVAFEMFSEDQEERIARHRKLHPKDAATLGNAVDWSKTGWPDWSNYQPLAQIALDAGAPIIAAGLPRATLRRIVKKGVEVLGHARVTRLGLNRFPGSAVLSDIRRELIETHCSQLPNSLIEPMIKVAVVKDAVMAEALSRSMAGLNGDGALLISGAGHARTDRGVPWHLRRLAQPESTMAVGFIEVDEGRENPGDYAASFKSDSLPFDFAWFTPRVDLEDPCKKYAKQLKRAGERKDGDKSKNR